MASRSYWDIFSSTTLDQRQRGLQYLCDYYENQQEFFYSTRGFDKDPALDFVFEPAMRDLLLLWLSCAKDDILTRLSWVEPPVE